MGICLAINACGLPFKIQSADVYLATKASKTEEALASQNPISINSNMATISPTSDDVSLIEFTPTPKSFGLDKKLILHRVQKGETLSEYASRYNTSEAAIIRVNYSLKLPLEESSVIVIPDGFSNVAQMPYFQLFLVTTDSLTIEELSSQLAASLDALLYYNNLYSGKQLSSGDWLLIPRMTSGF